MRRLLSVEAERDDDDLPFKCPGEGSYPDGKIHLK